MTTSMRWFVGGLVVGSTTARLPVLPDALMLPLALLCLFFVARGFQSRDEG